jgi:hypothetical protein
MMQGPYASPSRQQQEDQDMTEVTEASEGAAAAAAAAAADEEEVLGTQARQQQFEALHAYCCGRSQVSFADAMVRFDVPTEMLEVWFHELVAQGLLQVRPWEGKGKVHLHPTATVIAMLTLIHQHDL